MKVSRVAWPLFLIAFLTVPAAASRPSPGSRVEPEVEYMAIFMAGRKMGYAQHTRALVEGNVVTTMRMNIGITRGPTTVNITAVESSTETADGKPLAFKTTMDMATMAGTVEGTAGPDGNWNVATTTGRSKVTKEMGWPEGALLSEGLRLLSVQKGLREGTAYAARVFETSSLRIMEANIIIGPRKSVDLLGRVVTLTEVVTVLKGGSAEIVATSYVDENFSALKTSIPAFGMTLDLVACTKEFAQSKNGVLDFFDKLLLVSPASLKGLKAGAEVAYTLEPADPGAKWTIPSTDEQEVQPAQAGAAYPVRVTVRPLEVPKGVTFPYKGADANLLAATGPARYLQSDDKRVAELARQAIGDATDAGEAVRRIEAFVRKHITKKDLSVGYASAAEVAVSKQGDCTEHAMLAAALCRAAGIPAQVAVGMAYVPAFGEKKDVFGPHAWARAYVGGKWVSLDAALNGFDGGHILLACGDGDPSDFFNVINLLGQFRIAEVKVGK